jgi:hypothetical protein
MEIEDLVRYLRQSGLAPQSVDAIRAKLPRWVRHMQNRGHAAVPDLRRSSRWSPAEERAANDIDRLRADAANNQPQAHELRNLTGVRPYKV